MAKITVYRFEMYDIKNNEMQKSKRWATREFIGSIGGRILEDTAVEVDEADAQSEVIGLTKRNFDPAFRRRP
jgi:hypothetical protein